MLLDKKSLIGLQAQLNDHFGVEISRPKIRVIRDPQVFFNLYTAQTRERSIKKLIDLDSLIECFYDDKSGTIVFKGFRRDGKLSFETIRPQISLDYIVHEWIHHIQFHKGGYGETNFFEEASAEFCTFVLTGNVNIYSCYWKFVTRLWDFLDCLTTSKKKKYDLIRYYNASDNKKEVHDGWMAIFLNAHKRIKKTKRSLITQLESDELEPKISKIIEKTDSMQIREFIYKFHDGFKLKV